MLPLSIRCKQKEWLRSKMSQGSRCIPPCTFLLGQYEDSTLSFVTESQPKGCGHQQHCHVQFLKSPTWFSMLPFSQVPRGRSSVLGARDLEVAGIPLHCERETLSTYIVLLLRWRVVPSSSNPRMPRFLLVEACPAWVNLKLVCWCSSSLQKTK